jgi:peptide/nickel transport system substrate-binding protein
MGPVPRKAILRARRARRMLASVGCGLAIALAATACGSVGSTSRIGSTPVSGGVATWAEPAGNPPDYIYPFTPGQYFTVANTNYFQYLMYRPLYWFGKGSTPLLDPGLSLAYPPTYSGQVVTIRLKPDYRWSNGEQVTADDVLFWMHLMKANKVDWGGYVPPYFPDNVTKIRVVSTFDIQMTIKGAYSRSWFTSNELSQITPLPMAWDRTAAGKSNCTQVQADCRAVNSYLASLSGPGTYSKWAASPIWSIVDGPWRLTSFTADGQVTFAFNTRYSGQVPAHHITRFVEIPFTSEQAEYNVLSAPVGSQKLDVGYLPTVDAPVPPAGQTIGQNPLPGYSLTPLYTWGLDYFPINFANTTGQGAIFRQLYFRHAFQDLMNQAGVIDGPLHGYGVATVGPVSAYPATRYLSATGRQGDPFPYNPVQAKNLLVQNGWTVRPNGLSTCSRPGTGKGDCGAGIHAGQALSFTLNYATGLAWLESELKQLQSNAAELGIQVTLIAGSFNDVVSLASSCFGGSATQCHSWQMADWGQGWSYAPDYMPTGEELFMTTSFANFGQYSNATNDFLIRKTLQSSNLKYMYQWQDFLAKQIPVIYQPEAPSALVETTDSLHTGPWSPTLSINPENWYFLK